MKLKVTYFAILVAIPFFTIYCSGQQAGKLSPIIEVRSSVQIPELAWPRQGFMDWSNGYLISYAFDGTFNASPDEPAVILYDEQGHIARQATVWFLNAANTGVDDAAVGKSGELVVSGGITNPDGTIANYIGEIGAEGKLGRVIRTTPFLPVYVCVADDNTVWAYGEDRDENGKMIPSTLLLRQYSFDKGQIRTLLSGSDLGDNWELLRGHQPGDVNFRCTSHKVVLFSRVVSKLVEIDLNSGIVKISKLKTLPTGVKFQITGFAVTESGEIFSSFHERREKLPAESGILKLTFDSSGVGSWVAVPNSVGNYLKGGPIEHLLGTDGTNLVYTGDTNGTTHWARYR